VTGKVKNVYAAGNLVEKERIVWVLSDSQLFCRAPLNLYMCFRYSDAFIEAFSRYKTVRTYAKQRPVRMKKDYHSKEAEYEDFFDKGMPRKF